MSFQLHTHSVNPKEKLTLTVKDQPGSGGAHHRYEIGGMDTETNPLTILFQNGTIPENGVNGVTIEILLAICKHRLDCFQAGDFACLPNQLALEAIEQALDALHTRTKDRLARQVEGKLVK